MSQKVVSSFSGQFAPDESINTQGEVVVAVLRQAIRESCDLAGDDQAIERISFELHEERITMAGPWTSAFTVEVVSRLR